MTTIPAEWQPHKTIWTAWPSAGDLWGEDLDPARAEVAAMVRALWDEGRGDKRSGRGGLRGGAARGIGQSAYRKPRGAS